MHAEVPNRHPTRPQRVPVLSTLAAVARLDEPSQSQWTAMGEALQIGDPPMDALLDWMYPEDINITRPLFDKALRSGIASVFFQNAKSWRV